MVWISVKDKLPRNHLEVIVTYKLTSRGVVRVGTSRYYVGEAWLGGYRVTHWMPFPKELE